MNAARDYRVTLVETVVTVLYVEAATAEQAKRIALHSVRPSNVRRRVIRDVRLVK